MLSIFDEFKLYEQPELAKSLSEGIQTRTVRKGQVLQQKGDTIVNSYFLRKGCLRSYSLDQKGKERIFMFAPEG